MKILDVGSGYAPHPQATILSDAFLGRTIHRGPRELLLDERPFILCSAEYLPFKKQTIDILYCSAVLEHVDNPTLSLEEFKRVSKRYIVKVPKSISEAFFDVNYPGHKWACNPDGTFTPFQQKTWMVCLQRLLSFFWKRNFRIRFRERLTYSLTQRLNLWMHTFDLKSKEK
jgi:ubiquinone/menaquinone biosynthesis C-methylase UbiE